MANKKTFIVRIDERLCKACRLCVDFCPKGVLALADRLSERGVTPAEAQAPEACIGCRNCTTVCPEGCVELFVRTEEAS
jgi:2-oxoglutarate ferredoxin oxidoreductase subunit delta